LSDKKKSDLHTLFFGQVSGINNFLGLRNSFSDEDLPPTALQQLSCSPNCPDLLGSRHILTTYRYLCHCLWTWQWTWLV